MKTWFLSLSLGLICLNPSNGAEPQSTTLRQRLIGKKAVIRVAAGTAWGEIRNSPHEWGRGAPGVAKRFASGMGQHAVKTSVMVGVATLRHEDLRYHRSHKEGFGPRLGYAVSSTFITHKTTTGERTFAAGRTSGNLAAGFVSRVWMPARLHTIGSGMTTFGIMTGADVSSNVVQEFWPEIRHPKSR